MNKLTIQINNLEALERLIGGNTEVEMEIRTSVVQKFAEKHLKPLANADYLQNTINTIENNIKKQVDEMVQMEIGQIIKDWGSYRVDFNPIIKMNIEQLVKNQVSKLIGETVENKIKQLKDDNYFEKNTSYLIKDYSEDIIKREVNKRLEQIKASL